MSNEKPCIEHEAQIQELTRKTAELETRADYKDARITELIKDNKRIEDKIDKLTDTVNNVVVNSIKDDNNLKEEVTKLKTKIETQEQVLKDYKKETREQRDEDYKKTNQRLTYITVGICLLTFILTYILK